MINAHEAKTATNTKLLNDVILNIEEQANNGKYFSECRYGLINNNIIDTLKKLGYNVSQENGRYLSGLKSFVISWADGDDENQLLELQRSSFFQRRIVMAEFQAAAFSRQQTEDCRVQEIETQISIAIRQGKLEVDVSLEYLTNPIINKLTDAGYSILGGKAVETKTISWA